MPSPSPFADDNVNLDLLRDRAYNLRWAEQPTDVIPLTAADPDFPVAPAIVDAMRAYIDGGYFSYGPAEGLPDLRHTIALTMAQRRSIPCSSSQVFVTNSVASGMFLVARFALRPGDQAVLFDPVDFLFKQAVDSAQGRPLMLPIDTRSPALDIDALRRLITPQTRLFCLCNPHNPLGHVMSRHELESIAEICLQHNLWIMSDEIWSDIVYPPHQHISIASLSPEVARRTFTLHGFSKTFGLAGLRIGFIVAPSSPEAEAIIDISQARTTAYGVPTLSQVAAKAAYEQGWPWVTSFLSHLNQMRDYAVTRLNALPGIHCSTPQGTYVLFPDVRQLGMSSQDFTDFILQKARVALVPGAARWFGPGAEGHVRLCYSTSRRLLQEALDRIEQALEAGDWRLKSGG